MPSGNLPIPKSYLIGMARPVQVFACTSHKHSPNVHYHYDVQRTSEVIKSGDVQMIFTYEALDAFWTEN